MYSPSRRILIGMFVFISLNKMMTCGSPPAISVDQQVASSPVINHGPAVVIPEGWKKIDADGKFTFYLPPDLWDTGSMGIENYHKEYTNGKLHVSFDYHPYEIRAYPVRPESLGKNQRETTLEIDGKKSFMFFYDGTDYRKRPYYTAELSLGDLSKDEVILRMSVSAWNPARLKVAETIFRSIQLNPGSKNGTQSRK